MGGLAAACAMGRAGLKVDVFEQAPKFEEVGAGLKWVREGSRSSSRDANESTNVTASDPTLFVHWDSWVLEKRMRRWQRSIKLEDCFSSGGMESRM